MSKSLAVLKLVNFYALHGISAKVNSKLLYNVGEAHKGMEVITSHSSYQFNTLRSKWDSLNLKGHFKWPEPRSEGGTLFLSRTILMLKKSFRPSKVLTCQSAPYTFYNGLNL